MRKKNGAAKDDTLSREWVPKIATLKNLKAQMESLGSDARVIQDGLTAVMVKNAVHQIKGEHSGSVYQATLVQPTRAVLDEEKLRKKIGGPMWNKVTTRSLDMKKLEAYMASDPTLAMKVASCTLEVEWTTHVRTTKK